MITVRDLAIKSAQNLIDEYGENLPNNVSKELNSRDEDSLSPDESLELVFLGLSVAQVLIGIAQIAISVYFSKKSEDKFNRSEIEISISKKIINITTNSSCKIDRAEVDLIKSRVLETLFENEI